MTCDFLFFAEDPGAANYIANLPETLAEKGYSSIVLAEGSAIRQFNTYGIFHETATPNKLKEKLNTVWRPKVMAIGTSDQVKSTGLKLIEIASNCDSTSVGLVDGPAAYAHRFRGTGSTPTSFAPDWVLVPDKTTRNNYLSVGFNPKQVIILGHPHYDRIRAKQVQMDMGGKVNWRKMILPLEAQERIVLMFCSEISTSKGHADHSPKPDDTLKGLTGSVRRTDIVMEEFLLAAKTLFPTSFLILRLHPKTTEKEYSNYLHYFDMVSKGGNALEFAYSADLVVGLSTILLEEAALLNTPALSIVRRPEETKWLSGVAKGVIPVVTQRHQVGPAMTDLLKNGLNQKKIAKMLPVGATLAVASFLEKRLLSITESNQ